MVDLAVQAFTTSNYDLAAQIYERTITQNGPKLELYLGLADSLAKSGEFKKAFEAYSNAYRLGQVSPEKLKHLVAALVDILGKKEGFLPPMPEEVDMFSCQICKAIFIDPVTLACGHTFCRKCLLRDETNTCRKCNMAVKTTVRTMKTNILLSELTERWFPKEVGAVKLKADGNCHFEKRMFREAIEIYTKALELVPRDHTLASNRANAHAALGNFESSLADAEMSIRLRPDWPKAYFRKGAALAGLGRYEEGVLAYLQCLALDPSVTTVRNALAKALHKVLTPLEATALKHQELQSVFNPSPLSSALGTTPPSSQLVLDQATLMQLKLKLQQNLSMARISLPSFAAANFSAAAENMETAELMESSDSDSDLEATREAGKKICRSAPSSRPSSPYLRDSRRDSVRSLDRHPRKRASESTSSGEQDSLSPSKAGPRKQARSQELLPQVPSPGTADQQRQVDPSLMDKEDLECSLCLRLLWNPVTTPCGHTFCRGCLDRCLDHNCSCPLCKTTLAEYLAERRQTVTEAIVEILKKYFQQDFVEREKINEEEILEITKMGQDKQHEIPVFVCTLAFPSRPCPLHIFEPRYRLMVRQCMEAGTRQFGMCIPSAGDSDFADYGTMLEIRDVQYFPDGRSVVDAVGGKRFKVLDRGMRDGYNTAKVEFLRDVRLEGEEAEELKTLHKQVYKNVKDWLNSLPRTKQNNIFGQFGQFPDCDLDPQSSPDGPGWLWWVVALLPLDPRAQFAILTMTSLKDRLVAVRRVLSYVKRNPTL